ncbi:histidine kinase [Actinoplanes sp. NBRC 101535]|uniref:sensor histidine kinase n=1 Tax=Actinoplanes sp. NBRC 101535 TaxID=3032196 RepID=UPI0024A0CD2D|nr:histidine kinase [Actinoplanes sp. NBRC 101535]GLY00120.1 two-component sensor histidine kinase [Actinoplanes sp. NBRC 101535]
MQLPSLVPDNRGTATRNRLIDGIAIVLAFGYGSMMVKVGDAQAPGAFLPWQVDLLIGLLGALALVVRRRHPFVLATALVPFGGISVAMGGAIAVALFTAAVRCRPRSVLILGVVNVVTGLLYYFLQGDPPYDAWIDALVRIFVTGSALGWGFFIQSYRELTTSLRERAARLEAEQELREDRARLTERARISREMHDVIAHRMSLISLHAGALEVRGQVTPEELSIASAAIRTSAHEALEELRAVVGAQSARPEPPQPGLADMNDLVESAREAGMTVDYTNGVPADGPPVVLGRAAYRIVQEGLTNARKHGSGPAARVRVAGEAGHGLRITVINPFSGTPEAPSTGNGLGLVGIRERVGLAGGDVRYTTDDGEFRLEAELPWPA